MVIALFRSIEYAIATEQRGSDLGNCDAAPQDAARTLGTIHLSATIEKLAASAEDTGTNRTIKGGAARRSNLTGAAHTECSG